MDVKESWGVFVHLFLMNLHLMRHPSHRFVEGEDESICTCGERYKW